MVNTLLSLGIANDQQTNGINAPYRVGMSCVQLQLGLKCVWKAVTSSAVAGAIPAPQLHVSKGVGMLYDVIDLLWPHYHIYCMSIALPKYGHALVNDVTNISTPLCTCSCMVENVLGQRV